MTSSTFWSFYFFNHNLYLTIKSHNCQELYLNNYLDLSHKILYTRTVAGDGGGILKPYNSRLCRQILALDIIYGIV